MGYAVLNIKKASGNDAATSAHIERTIDPKNADKTRTHLNKELIHFPDGVNNRTEAIQYRIEHAGITRKINEKQVRALRFMLTGSPEDMYAAHPKREQTGRMVPRQFGMGKGNIWQG